jgi:hypothetical protein
MPNWKVIVQGIGSLGNGTAADVESILDRFLDDLKARGHSITTASAAVEPAEPAGPPAEEPAVLPAPEPEAPFGTESEPETADVEVPSGPDSGDSGGTEVGPDPGTVYSPPPTGN